MGKTRDQTKPDGAGEHKTVPNGVLLAGDIMRDVIVRPGGPLREGSDRCASISLQNGGSAANQSVWMAQAGLSPRLIARVGETDLEDMQAGFSRRGVRPLFVGDSSRPTGMLVSLIGKDGERSFYSDRGANENLSISDVPDTALDDCRLLVLSGYSFFLDGPRKMARELMARAKQKNIEVAIDPASSGFIEDVGNGNFLDWISGATYLFPNAQEAILLSGRTGTERQARALAEKFEHVVVTLGENGALAVSREGGIFRVRAKAVDVVDTTGAGDAFAAGFLGARLRGETIARCLAFGVELAALAVTRVGGQP